MGFAPTVNAQLVPSSGSYINAYARASVGPVTDLQSLESSPSSGSGLAILGANTSSYSYSIDAGGFSMSFEHERGEHQTGNPILPTVNTSLNLRFTVDTPSTYELEGLFEFVDPVGKRAYLQAHLIDFTAGAQLYSSWEENQQAVSESFWLTEAAAGSLMGDLLPGHNYRLWVQVVSSDMLFSQQSVSTSSGYFRLTVIPERSTVTVEIDIKPQSPGATINPLANGVIPVAILGTESFDVYELDLASLEFGPEGATPAYRQGGHFEDVNDDGFLDVVSHFQTLETGLYYGDVEACITGELLDGTPVEGCEPIQLVPACGLGFELTLLVPLLMWARGRRNSRARG